MTTNEENLLSASDPFETDDRFVSFENAKKLCEAGYPQRAFMWIIKYQDFPGARIQVFLMCGNNKGECPVSMTSGRHLEAYACPMAEEILRRLPWKVNYKGQDYYFRAWMDAGNCLHFSYQPKNGLLNLPILLPDDGDMMGFVDRPAANAAAAMYCHLSKNNLLPTP